ncbi:MAG TPA: prepilin-type N-terminal cleavage/methylation domain-containing protein [Aquella sp.]|nr:prepilin-type N-terminal cleavage/methylation domain-containing protein [Aquella sp.]
MYKKTDGFTLIEIIIVLAIIAVMASVAMLKVSGTSYGGFLNKANKIAIFFEVLSDHAVYTNSFLVCEPNPIGLDCKKYKNDEWNDLPLSKVTTWNWPEDIRIEQVRINGRPMKQGDKIYFTPDYRANLLSIRITNGKFSTWIDNDLTGEYKVSN